MRERAEIAVVDLDCDEDAVVCVKVPDDGGTVFARRSDASSVGRRVLLRAIEEASHHIAELQGTPHLDQAVSAVDLD